MHWKWNSEQYPSIYLYTVEWARTGHSTICSNGPFMKCACCMWCGLVWARVFSFRPDTEIHTIECGHERLSIYFVFSGNRRNYMYAYFCFFFFQFFHRQKSNHFTRHRPSLGLRHCPFNTINSVRVYCFVHIFSTWVSAFIQQTRRPVHSLQAIWNEVNPVCSVQYAYFFYFILSMLDKSLSNENWMYQDKSAPISAHRAQT